MDKPIYDYTIGSKDFPGRMALTLFFAGCNLKCDFCYNKAVATAKDGNFQVWDMKKMLLKMRDIGLKDMAVVFSGGEPTVSPYLMHTIDTFDSIVDPPVKLGIHTNGLSLPSGENPFESVILSLKNPADMGVHYMSAIQAALSYYSTAKYKEIRVVSDLLSVQQVFFLNDIQTDKNGKDWKVNVVQPIYT